MSDDAKNNEPNLYERVGGEDGIAKLVDAFYVEVLADPELAPFFTDVAIEKLLNMQRELFAAALDGPVNYTGRPLAHVHHGMGIKPSHMARYVGHLLSTLEGFDLDDGDRDDIISRINIYADEIMGGAGLDG